MMTKQRTNYDRDYKEKLVELSHARGNAKKVADEYGIAPELLYRWRKEASKYKKNWKCYKKLEYKLSYQKVVFSVLSFRFTI